MSEATDSQMQTFANERVRPFAEAMRLVFATGADDKAAIDDIYARATENPGALWQDNRTDGPPHLLQSGYDGTSPSNPDDMLNFNAFLVLLDKFKNGSFSSVEEANSAAALWTVLQRACVRPLGV